MVTNMLFKAILIKYQSTYSLMFKNYILLKKFIL